MLVGHWQLYTVSTSLLNLYCNCYGTVNLPAQTVLWTRNRPTAEERFVLLRKIGGEKKQESRRVRCSIWTSSFQKPRVRIPAWAGVFVCCECRGLSGRGLCDERITRPEESYRLLRRCVWSRNIKNRGSIYIYIYIYIYDISSLRVNDLTLILLTWRKWTPNNASKWQMGFNSTFKGLIVKINLYICTVT
jgi:hypothetical protein